MTHTATHSLCSYALFPVVQWNMLDFVVVVAGFVSLAPGVGNVEALRVIRVLRPLRTLNRVKKLRVIVLALLGSLAQLANVALLITFLFTVFSIVGLQVRGAGPALFVQSTREGGGHCFTASRFSDHCVLCTRARTHARTHARTKPSAALRSRLCTLSPACSASPPPILTVHFLDSTSPA